jgi:hypothetical protein
MLTGRRSADVPRPAARCRPPRAARCWLALLLVCAVCRPAAVAEPPRQHDALWQQIGELAELPPTTQPQSAWFDQVRARRTALLRAVRLYETLYPGGEHYVAVLRLEFQALFELGTLRGAQLAELCERAAQVLASGPAPEAAAEAAYWRLLCQGDAATSQPGTPASSAPSGGATSQPTADLPAPTAQQVAAWHDYVREYPGSRYVPRIAARLFAEAAQRDDVPSMQRLAAHLAAQFPEHPTTALLAGKVRRRTTIGQPFWPELACDPAARRAPLDHGAYAGRPVMFLVWASYDGEARHAVGELARWQKAHPDVPVIGIALDETRDKAVASARELGAEWPQCVDGLGWGGEFVRAWGVDAIPFAFLVDSRGLLVGSGGDWRALTEPSPPR